MLKSPMFKSGSRAAKPAATAPYPQTARLIIFTDIKNEADIIKLEKTMSVGRKVPGSDPDIALDSPIVSRKHGNFIVRPDGFYYEDTDSFNGTFINGILYKHDQNPASAPIPLKNGDVIRFDSYDAAKAHKNAVTIVFSTTYDKRSKWRREKPKTPTVTVGKTPKNILEFDVSKMAIKSAQLSINGTECFLESAAARANIKYNNAPLPGRVKVRNKDVFTVDDSILYFDDGQLLYSVCLVTEPGLDIALSETNVPDKFGKKVLLKDIYLNIDRGDFALIIGGSGAGKSTFMNSILGKYDIVGQISVCGQVATSENSLTSDIAYVPQTLPLRKEERLIDVVTDTCILRCKRKMSNSERKKFVLNALDSVGLKGKANMEIKKLSGGEQRRAAIANEVVTDSNIFFLDEPDSGLDPKSGMELMNNLKAISDVGKMVMLISHNYASYPNPERIYSKIIILAKSNHDGIGRLAFCGSVPEALEFFGVEELKDITKLINPVSENGEGRADEFVEKYRRMRTRG
ncbi:MAG: ATP-binding cassette domain-containing protein [Clostridia bacterium]|nr:ATP-binding cassette domain-containing protein [Clostridia bacterium]